MLMETISRWIGGVNDVLWTYVLVAALLGCAVWFTLRTRGVQFRLLGEMMRVLGESAGSGPEGERHVSSFQAFAVSLASRVGTGNLAGVATAIVVGGPGAVFWMWVIALVGAASAFVESTLAQLYKRRGRDSFIGGPAYYMQRGLGRRWMGVLFAVLISVTFGFAFNSVQSNTICAAWEGAFGADRVWAGVVLTALTLLIIFGGIRRIARVSGVIVPIMALGYIVLALGVVLFNLGRLPEVLELIVADAFGWEQTLGGAVGAALMQGIKRGLFSNEAGMGSAPNVAATAHVSHPVKQGLIQTLGVFTDTLVICTCTAFIILFGGVPDASLNGIQLTQAALESEIGPAGGVFVAVAILGCGVELGGKHNKELATFNLDNLRFNKIVICTDADVDGYQIRTLVLTMLYRLTPTLIEKGYVYIAESPLYEITTKERTYFAYTEPEKTAFLEEIGEKKYTIQRSKGLGENDPEMMWLTTMNPESRRLIKVMPTDVVQTAQVFDILLGDNLAGRKEHIAQHGAEYLDDLDVS